MFYGNLKNRVSRPVLGIFLTAMRNWSSHPTEVQGSLGTADPVSGHLYALPGRRKAAWRGHVMEAQLTVQPAHGPCPDLVEMFLQGHFLTALDFVCITESIFSLRGIFTHYFTHYLEC